jgi:signal transduction histidine kinase
LVAGVAHEINNPVNFIYGNIKHARDYIRDLLNLLHLYQEHYPNPAIQIQEEAEAIDIEFLTNDLPKLLNSMKVGAERIQQIVASLRTFSRMDEAEMKAVNIHECIDSTLMILQSRLKARPDRAKIEVIRQYSQMPLVECYAGQLNQVFMNILSNAIDALEDMLDTHAIFTPVVTIRAEMADDNRVLIQISDNGIGIPTEKKARIFDPFFTTKTIGKGTGLGLSISYQIVTEKHGGKLWCQSELGEGTHFFIEIPACQDGQGT